MIEAVFLGTVIPLIFLIIVLKGENRLIMCFFLWGLIAFALSLFINTTVYRVLDISQNQLEITWAPVVEEFFKALPLGYFLFTKKDIRYPIVYFAMVSGIGFSIQENYLYLLENYVDGSPVIFIIIRSVTTCIMHGLSVAILGYGIQVIRKIRILTLSVLFGLFSLSVTIHALYNLYINSSIRIVGMLLPISLYLIGMLIMKDENVSDTAGSDTADTHE